MAAALGSLVVSLEANMARFTGDMDKAAYQTEQFMKRMERDAKMVGTAMATMGIAGTGALALMVRQSINAADSLRDMSQQTAIAVQTLNGMGFAASQAGGSLEGMVAAAGKLNKSISEAARGSEEQANAFKVMGISVKTSTGELKTADQVMIEMADKFASYADGPEKVALSLATMGKSGAEQIPVLNEGGEAMRQNIEYARQYSGVTTELAIASDEFNDTMGKLALQQKGFANTMTAAVLPILQAIADETLRATEESKAFGAASSGVRTVLETFVVMGSEVAFVFKGIGKEVGGIAAQLAAVARGDFKLAFGTGGIGDIMTADAENARKEQDAFIARIMDRSVVTADGTPAAGPTARAPRLPGGGGRTGGKAGMTDAQKLEQDARRFVARLQEQADTFGKTGAAALQYQTEFQRLPKMYQEQALAIQQGIDGMRAQEAATKSAIKADQDAFKIMDDLRKADAQAQERNQQAVSMIQFGLMDEVAQQEAMHQMRLEELQKFHDAKFENIVLANTLIEEEEARHRQALADMQTARDLQSLSMTGNTLDQLYGLMQKSGQEQSALAKAAFLASKAIAVAEIILNTEVAAAKAGAQLGIFGIPMATFIRATGYASAGMVAGMAIAGMREKGGPVWAGGAFVVGEKGPEIFKPTGSGTIIPNSAIGRGPSDQPLTLTIVNQTSGRIDKVTEQRISPTERAIIIQEASAATAAELSNPNSRMSRSLARNYATQRSR